MIILGVSTSSRKPSVAVMVDGEIKAFMSDESGRSHSAVLAEIIERALKDIGVGLEHVDLFAVDIGPGSFTGVRIGVSAVNAMAYASNKKVIAVSSLAALRHLAVSGDCVCTMIDARNGNAYAALYQSGIEIIAPCPCVISEFMDNIPTDAQVVGDCNGGRAFSDAKSVLQEAKSILEQKKETADYVCPLYLRPSQAERMRR